MTIQVAYEKIHDILHDLASGKIIPKQTKVNFYGVITYISPPSGKKCTSITVVDESCLTTEKLKCNVFHEPNTITIADACQVGDIIRCHRFYLQFFNGNAQGTGGNNWSSWCSFKRDTDDTDFQSNKSATVDQQDISLVKGLRDWLKTNPNLDALVEAGLVFKEQFDLSRLNPIDSVNTDSTLDFYLSNLKIVQFSRISEGFLDIICQVFAICKKNEYYFIVAWDGTKPNAAVAAHQENEFQVEKRQCYPSNGEVLFSKEAFDEKELFQVYIFDEFTKILDTIQPGDYVLLRNLKVVKPNDSMADLIMKLPGEVTNLHKKHRRTILKLTDFKADISHLTKYEDVTAVISKIKENAVAQNVSFVSDQVFVSEFKSNILDTNMTFDENAYRQAAANLKQSDAFKSTSVPVLPPLVASATTLTTIKKTKVDELLEDEEYEITDDEEDTQSKANDKNDKENNNNIIRFDLNTTLSQPPITTSTQNLSSVSPIKRTPTKRFCSLIENTLLVNVDTLNHSPNKIAKSNSFSSLITDDASSQAETENQGPLTQSQTSTVHSRSPVIKKANKFDPTEICTEIDKIPRLANYTFLAPFLESNPDHNTGLNTDSCLQSLADLEFEMNSKAYTRSEVLARLYNFANYKTHPAVAYYTSIFVHCKKCKYINFVPFNLIGSQQPLQLSKILQNYQTDIGDSLGICMMSEEQQREEARMKSLESSKNFSLRWLNIAEITSFKPNEESSNRIPLMFYMCPRCLMLGTSNCSQDDLDSDKEIDEDSMQTLEYIFRFWFDIRDKSGNLSPVLLEGDVAEKFLNGITATEYFTNSFKRNQVINKLESSLDTFYTMKIDSFRLSSPEARSEKVIPKNRPEVLHKIVDLKEIVLVD